ncbi:Fe2+-dependent dioxygenase [Nannocystis pusilla]|uniref:Fe2+-dependent dioxygenase n=1 Tax=Nannocystis pusilla TaxID=889268 RepID=UPI003DA58C61
MCFVIKNVLSLEDLTQIRASLMNEAFIDGRATSTLAGKNNLQLPQEGATYEAASALVRRRLLANESFQLAVYPRTLTSPLFSKYEMGMEYPEHVDSAVMGGCRADVAVTLFLSELDAYEGGELVVDTGNGERRYRLDAGDAIAYPASTLHRVARVARGTRLVAVMWVQSLIRDPAKRQLLHDLGSAVNDLKESVYSARVRRSHANLLRLWAEL